MRILIANPYGIGDVLFSLPLGEALREVQPDGFIGYLCNRRTEELIKNWPFLDWVTVFEKDEFRESWRQSKRDGFWLLKRLFQEIQRQRFDLLIDLSMGWHVSFAALLAGIPRRIGFDFRNRGCFLTDRLPISGFHDQPVAQYYLDLLTPLGFPKPHEPRLSLPLSNGVDSQVRSYLQSHGLSQGERLVGIVPGGGASWGPYAPFKQWPPDRFASVADHVGLRYGARILLIGDSREAPLCQAVAQGMKQRPILAIQLPSLLLLAGLVKRCDLVVGNDSGPMHLATAVGTRTVTIFGPVDGSVYGPFPQKSIHRVVSKGLACRPCYRGFRFPPCPWDNACLKTLSASDLIQAIDELLSERQ